jgi:hypothetical protein
MNRPRHSQIFQAAIFLILAAALTPAFAQDGTERQYEVSRGGKRLATVTTSASSDAVVVSIYRQGRPTHHYRAYPPAATITVHVDERKLFTYYIEAERIAVTSFGIKSGRAVDESFSLDLNTISGPELGRRRESVAIRQRLEEDMRILRAIRGYDDTADVRLAEQAYVVLTYDNSIIDGKAPADLTVTETTRVTARRGGAKARTASGIVPPRRQGTLGQCLDTCESQYTECQQDQSVADKSVCHKNRTSCTNTCNSVYGKPKSPPRPS